MKITTRGTDKKHKMCNVYRSMDLSVKHADTKDEFRRAKVTRSAILSAKYTNGKCNLNKAYDVIAKGMADINYASEYTAMLQSEEVSALVNKYLAADDRTCTEPKLKSIDFFGNELIVSPDFMYEEEAVIIDNDTTITVPVVEVVNFTTGKQKFTTSSRGNVENQASRNLESLGLLWYGREQLRIDDNTFKKGIVRVAFDALKTDKDVKGDYSREWSVAKTDSTSTKGDNRCWIEVLFNEQGNIENKIPYSDINIGKSRKRTNAGLLDGYKESVSKWITGVERCTGTNCSECEYNNICNFNSRPSKVTKEEVVKQSLGDVNVTKEQSKVIGFRDGIAVVDAGPGAGKSFCVSMRVASMLAEGSKPEDFLLMSFSKAAVEVLKNRIIKMVEIFGIDVDAEKIEISTFNSFYDKVVRKYHKDLGFKEEPSVADDIEVYDLVLESIDWDNPIPNFDYKNPNMQMNANVLGVGRALLKLFREIQEKNLDKTKILQTYPNGGDAIWETYERFVGKMKEHCYLTYADQANLISKMIDNEPDDVLVGNEYAHIIVDEFQDSNQLQLDVLKTLIGHRRFKSLLVIGDDAQAIYGFRNTSPDMIINFDNLIGYPCTDMYLTVNHRSNDEIVQASMDVLKPNKNKVNKKLVSASGKSGERPNFIGYNSQAQEMSEISNKIKELVDNGVEPKDIAFIGFKKSTIARMGKALSDLGIMSQLDMPEVMLNNSRVKAAIGFAKFVLNSEHTIGLLEFFNAVSGNKLLTKDSAVINDIIRSNVDTFENTFPLLSEEKKREYILNSLENLLDGEDTTYSQFLDLIKGKTRYSALGLARYMVKFEKYDAENTAEKESDLNAVSLCTCHSSKGKEWKYVFGTISDFAISISSREEIEERRRLIFVLVSRAKEHLTVSCVRSNSKDEEEERRCNMFYNELAKLPSFNFVVV